MTSSQKIVQWCFLPRKLLSLAFEKIDGRQVRFLWGWSLFRPGRFFQKFGGVDFLHKKPPPIFFNSGPDPWNSQVVMTPNDPNTFSIQDPPRSLLGAREIFLCETSKVLENIHTFFSYQNLRALGAPENRLTVLPFFSQGQTSGNISEKNVHPQPHFYEAFMIPRKERFSEALTTKQYAEN